ncbi:hypothetical protein FG386_000036 [Cryptosporidium ryanae]|uniref:uncharacterized protein n=1 Tax=Cryptosporidium ryanae TaxID=515981 RepID=UPI003519DBCB|nr:hypothetical protein FG386_000036 [Cryptosporidium ryanae]
MRKVRYFFNIKPYIETLVSESVACVKDISVRMIEDLEHSGAKSNELKKRYLQIVDYKLAKPMVEKINNFGNWLEKCGILEIPDKVLSEYMHLVSLSDEKITDSVDIEVDENTQAEVGITSNNVKSTVNIDFLISDIISTIDQIKLLDKELRELEKTLDEKKVLLNSTLKGRKIVEVFGPLVGNLKTKYSTLLNEGTIEKFRVMMDDFCVALEQRNELRYKLVFGENLPDSKHLEVENKEVLNTSSEALTSKSETEQTNDIEKTFNAKEKTAKRHKSVVDRNAMKIFARWSLPMNNSTKNIQN